MTAERHTHQKLHLEHIYVKSTANEAPPQLMNDYNIRHFYGFKFQVSKD